MFKKTLLITSILLVTLSTTVNATPKSGKIVGCGNTTATLQFTVNDMETKNTITMECGTSWCICNIHNSSLLRSYFYLI